MKRALPLPIITVRQSSFVVHPGESVLLVQELLGQSDVEIDSQMTEIVGQDGLALGRLHGEHLDQDLGALLDGMHEAEGKVEVLTGAEHAVTGL